MTLVSTLEIVLGMMVAGGAGYLLYRKYGLTIWGSGLLRPMDEIPQEVKKDGQRGLNKLSGKKRTARRPVQERGTEVHEGGGGKHTESDEGGEDLR